MNWGILAAAFCAACSTTAMADWQTRSGEDPMTDQKWVATSAPFGSIGIPQVLFKCWAGGSLQVGIVVGSYDDSASYAAIVPIKFRVDKEEFVDLLTTPTNLGGMLTLAASSETSDDLVPLLKRIGESKQRVVLSINEGVFQTNSRGSAKAVTAMWTTCGLSDEAQNADEAPADKIDAKKD